MKRIFWLLMLLASPAWATTFYVGKSGNNANTCATAQSPTAGSRKLTIKAGISCMSPSDTLIIGDGTFDEFIRSNVDGIPNGSIGAPTVIKAEHENFAIVFPTICDGGNGVINTYGATYITFDGLAADATNCIENGPFYFKDLGGVGSTHIVVKNGTARNAIGPAFSGSNLPSGISMAPQDDFITVTNMDVFNTKGHGIYVSGNNSIIENNRVHDMCRTCPNGNANDFNWNLYGIHAYSGGGAGHPSNAIIRGNTVYKYTFGMLISIGDNNAASNNVLYNNIADGIRIAYGASHTKLYHNTIVANGSYGISTGNDTSGSDIKNNIQTLNLSGPILDSAPDTTSAGNFTSDPSFINAPSFDFHLSAGSSAIDTVPCLSLVPTDKDGIPRPQGPACDAGAYERTASFPRARYVSTTGTDTGSCAVITSPCGTILYGISQMIAGDNLQIGCGVLDGSGSCTYSETLDNVFATTGTSNATFTIQTFPGEIVRIRPTTGNFVIQTGNNQSWLIFKSGRSGFKDLILDGSANAGLNVARIFSDHVTFQDVEVTGGGREGGAIFFANATSQGNYGRVTRALIHDFGNDVPDHGINIQGIGSISEDNEIYNGVGAGIQLYGGGTDVGNCRINGNYIHNMGRAGLRSQGLIIYNVITNGCLIYNNIITVSAVGSQVLGSGSGGLLIGGGSTGVRGYNNTFYLLSTYAVLIQGANGGNVVQNNIGFANQGGFLDNDGVNIVSNNLISDPLFANPTAGDFHLTMLSPAVDVGLTLSFFNTDKEGATRPQGTAWDVGALESSYSASPPPLPPNPPPTTPPPLPPPPVPSPPPPTNPPPPTTVPPPPTVNPPPDINPPPPPAPQPITITPVFPPPPVNPPNISPPPSPNAPSPMISLVGTFRYPDNSTVNGVLVIQLASRTSFRDVCYGSRVSKGPTVVIITNGVPQGNASFLSSDCLSPFVPYTVRLQDTSRRVIFQDSWLLASSSSQLDVGTMMPTQILPNSSTIISLPPNVSINVISLSSGRKQVCFNFPFGLMPCLPSLF